MDIINQTLLEAYWPILVFIALALAVSVLLVFLGWARGPRKGGAEKLSTYECGFEPFEAPRKKFDVRFYLVAILFIIFDLEVAFLFPWAISLGEVGLFGFWSMILFLTILTIGFAYEWKKGALEWE